MDSLLSAADKAMYVCKARGKNRYGFSDAQAGARLSRAPWIVFNDAHVIGVAAIDEQHRQLVHMVNELNQSISAAAHDAASIATQFDELIQYTVFHFQTEHRLMLEHAYPDMEAHDYEHGQLTSELRLIVQKKNREGDLLVLQRIKDWLLNHILTADKAFGRFLNDKGVR
jgi:hemerythrin-like metal-binding protein